MSLLRHIVWPVARLSSAVCAVAVYGQIVIYLAFGLIALLALTRTFGSPRCQHAVRWSWLSPWAGHYRRKLAHSEASRRLEGACGAGDVPLRGSRVGNAAVVITRENAPRSRKLNSAGRWL
jgi:hypothetical protein